jgi:signal transduction histidine kinase
MKDRLAYWMAKRKRWDWSFRFIFMFMLIALIGTIVYIGGLLQCGTGFVIAGNTAFIVIMVTLLGFELLEDRRYGYETPRRMAIILLLARMILIEAVVAIDCGQISYLLYLIVPFYAYFAFGASVSNGLSILYVILVFGRLWLTTPQWYADYQTLYVVIVFISLLVFMRLLAQVIQRDQQNRQRTEQLLADLEVSHSRLQAYADEIAELAAMEERNRLARDIHDSLGNFLTAVNIQLEKALAYKDRDPVVAEQAIRDAKQAASEALQDVRRSVAALRDSDQSFSFVTATDNLLQGLDDGHFSIRFDVVGEETDYNRAVLLALYRATQEGLTNVQKHAQAEQLSLLVEFGEQEACLQLHDDGSGFDTALLAEAEHDPDKQFGLQGIQERLELVNGQLRLDSSAKGTTMIVTVPKDPLKLEKQQAMGE